MIQNISVTLSNDAIQVVPGEIYEIAVTVTNNSREVERFELRLNGLDPSWYKFDWSEMLLYPDPPGNEGTVYLRLTIPADAIPGNFNPALEVQGDHGESLAYPFLLTVNRVDGASPELTLVPPSQASSRRVTRFRLDLTNPLNQPVNLTLGVVSERPDVRFQFYPPLVELEAFGTANSLVQVEPLRRNWYQADRRYEFSVLAENQPNQAQGVLIQTAVFPWLRKLLLTPLLFGLLLALPLLFVVALLLITLWPSPKPEAVLPPAICSAVDSGLTPTLYARPDNFTDIMLTEADGVRTRRVGQVSSATLPGLFASMLSVSPNGQTLAYVTARNEAMDSAAIVSLDLTTQTQQTIVTVPSGLWPSRPLWSEDGSQLAYVVRNNGQLELRTVNVRGDRTPRVLPTPRQLTANEYYGSPAASLVCWSNDGRRLVVRPKNSSKQYEVSLTADANTLPREVPIQPLPALVKPAAAQRLALKEPPLAPPLEGTPCFTRPYSQNAPEWFGQAMKPGTEKIGEAGCALTSAVMLLNYYNVSTDPNELNGNCLGNDANPFDWVLTANRCGQGKIQGGQRQDFSWNGLNSILKQGRPAIVGLLGGQTGTHYVVVVGGSDSIAATYRVNDPWDGSNYKSLGYFVSKGYQLRWLVDYNGTGAPPCASDRTDPADKFQAGFKIGQPADGGIYNKPINILFDTPPNSTNITATLFSATFNTASPNQLNGQALLGQPISTTVIPVTTPVLGLGQGGVTNQTGQRVISGYQVSLEGSYTLVVEEATADGINRQTIRFTIDYTPPEVKLGPLNTVFEANTIGDGIFVARRPVPLDIQASDNLSGIASIEYQVILNNNPGQGWLLYSNDTALKPVTLDKPGEYRVLYRATDGAGNVSVEKSLRFIYSTTTGDVTLPPATTQVAATTVVTNTNTTPTATPAPPGILNASPAQITFEATQNLSQLLLTNIGQGPLDWVLEPPGGNGVGFLGFDIGNSTLQPGGSIAVPVRLLQPNLTTAPINTSFRITYNQNQASTTISVVINPQPAPVVQVLSPTASSTLNKLVTIKLQVTTSGSAKPDHANINATLTDQPGGTPAPQAIGTASPASDWTLNWDVSLLPPQGNITLSIDICWTGDPNSCLKGVAAVTGLSIGKPSAVITLNPASDKLQGKVKITAVPTGTVDHITYTYTAGGNPTNLPPGTKANNYATEWDTTLIPPQTGITLNVLVCWGPNDDPNSCGGPSNQLPAAFTVEAPVMTVNPLSANDAKELPLQLNVGGTVSKVNNPATAIFIIAKAPVVPTDTSFKVGGFTPGAGNASWTTTIDTTSWQPNSAITLATKICWDGNITGSYCTDGPPLTGAISPFSAVLTSLPPDLSVPVTLTVTPTPLSRVNLVKFLVSYTPASALTGLSPFQDKELTSQQATAPNFAINFDALALGLKPGQITFKLVACGSTTNCGAPSAPSAALTIPLPTISNILPDPATQTSPLTPSAPFTVTATLGGRGAFIVKLVETYKAQPPASTVVTTSVGTPNFSVKAGDSMSFTWDTSNTPPQTGLKLDFYVCWGTGLAGDLEQSFYCYVIPAYSNLSINEPKVTNVYFNGGQGSGSTLGAYAIGNPLPVPITSTSRPVVKLPVEADLTNLSFNVNAVNWRLDVQGMPQPVLVTPAAANLVSAGTGYTTPATLSIDTSKITVADLTSAVITLTGSPVWKSFDGKSTVDYYFNPDDRISVRIKFVNMSVLMDGGGGLFSTPQPIAGSNSPIDPRALIMFKAQTVFSGTLGFGSDPNPIKRIVFSASYSFYNRTINSSAIITDSTASWSFNWNHLNDGLLDLPTQTPRPSPDDIITLSWQVCTTATPTDFANCLPVNTSGALLQATGLRLAALRYDQNSLINILPGDFFNSTFTSTVELKNVKFDPNSTANSATPTVLLRYFAYPTPGSSGTPNVANRVLLKTRPDYTATTDPTKPYLISQSVFWSDDGTDNGTPLATEINNLASAASADYKISIGVQFCTQQPTSAAEEARYCNDWSGNEISQITAYVSQNKFFSDYSAVVSGKQTMVIIWKLYRGATPAVAPGSTTPFTSDPNLPSNVGATDPYGEFLQPNDPTTSGDAFIYIRTRQIGSDLVTKRELSYTAPGAVTSDGKGGTLTTTPNPNGTSNNFKDYYYQWSIFGGSSNPPSIVGAGLPVDTQTTRGVELKAIIEVQIGTTSVATQASVFTHGSADRPRVSVTSLNTTSTTDATGGSAITTNALSISWTVTNTATTPGKPNSPASFLQYKAPAALTFTDATATDCSGYQTSLPGQAVNCSANNFTSSDFNLTTNFEYDYRVVAQDKSGSVGFSPPNTRFAFYQIVISSIQVINDPGPTGNPNPVTVKVTWNVTSSSVVDMTKLTNTVKHNNLTTNTSISCTAGSCIATITGLTAVSPIPFEITSTDTNSIGIYRHTAVYLGNLDASARPSLGTLTYTIANDPGPNGSANPVKLTVTWTTTGSGSNSFAYGTSSGSYPSSASTFNTSCPGGNCTAVINGLATGTTYYFKVGGGDSNGNTSYTLYAYDSTTTTVRPTLSALSYTITTDPTPSGSSTPVALTVSWTTTGNGPNTFKYGTSSGSYPSSASSFNNNCPGGNCTAVINGLSANTTYYFKVSGDDTNAGLNYTAFGYGNFTTNPNPTLGTLSYTLTTDPTAGGSATPVVLTVKWTTTSATNTFAYGTSSGSYPSSATTFDSTCPGGNCTAVINGLAVGTTYFFKVTGTSGSSFTAEYDSFTTTPSPALSTLSYTIDTDPTASGSSTPVKLTVKWTTVLGNTANTFAYGTSSGSYPSSASSFSCGAINCTAIINGLASGTTYYFKVSSSIGASTTYRYDNVTTNPNPTLSALSYTLTTDPTAGGSATPVVLTVKWTTTGSGSNTFAYGTSSGSYPSGPTTFNASCPGGNCTAVINGLASATTYYFQVSGSGTGGTTYRYDSFTTNPNPTLGALSFSTATDPTAGGSATPVILTVKWTTTSATNTFAYGTSSGSYPSSATTFDTTCPSGNCTAVINGLASATTYYFKVSGTNTSGTTFRYANFKTDPKPAITNVQVASAPAGAGFVNITITWNDVSGATFAFDYSTDSSYGSSKTPTCAAGTCTVTFAGLASPGTPINYRITATDAVADSNRYYNSFTP